MKLKTFITTCAVATGMTIIQAGFAQDQSFTPAQQQQIKTIVHDYLVQNPQILVEVSQALQQQEMQKAVQQAQSAIKQNAQDIFNSPDSPVLGNAQGDVTLVEFLDYQCPHCRDMESVVSNLIKKDPKLRVVIKELPIFGDSSRQAALAALASQNQGKFAEMNTALFDAKRPFTQDSIMQVAQSVGLDANKLKQDMQDPKFAKQLDANMGLAQKLGLIGTPAFVIGNRAGSHFGFVPGATTEDNLQKLIKQARQSA